MQPGRSVQEVVTLDAKLNREGWSLHQRMEAAAALNAWMSCWLPPLLRHLLLPYWQPVLLNVASLKPSWQTTCT